MPGIYLTGPSGTGKTTFCNEVASALPISLRTNLVTGLFANHPELRDVRFMDKQLIITLKFMDLHNLTDTGSEWCLSDRSILDVMAWSDNDPELIKLLPLTPPAMILLIPTPPLDWYLHHSELVFDRSKYYAMKRGFEQDHYLGWSNEFEAIKSIYEIECRHQRSIHHMIQFLGWRHHMCRYTSDVGFFQQTWQENAMEVVREIWDS